MTFLNKRAKFAGLASIALAATSAAVLFASQAAFATAVPGGDNGTVKIHRSTTPVADRRNQPHVCSFYLDAFGFDPAQSVSWQIKSWPPTGDRTVAASGVLSLDDNGAGHTGDMTLPDGHYKLFWNFNGEKGFAKQKVFWVACPAATPTQAPTTPTTTPTSPAPTCTCASTPPITPPPTTPPAPPTQTPPVRPLRRQWR